jgi:hypothetical protein
MDSIEFINLIQRKENSKVQFKVALSNRSSEDIAAGDCCYVQPGMRLHYNRYS